MFRGTFVQAGSVAPITAAQMLFNGLIESTVTNGTRPLSDGEAMVTALCAGAASAVLYNPVDVMTIHQQKLGQGPKETFRSITSKYDFSCLWHGVGSMAKTGEAVLARDAS